MPPRHAAGATAAGRSVASMTARRATFAALVIVAIAAMTALLAATLAPGGLSAVDLLLIALFAVTLPWFAIGFWNAVIGLAIMRLSPDPVATALPAAARLSGDEPITAATAILLCIRNETPDRIVRNAQPLLAGLVAASAGDRFHLFVLSDTSDSAIAAEEERRFGRLADEWRGRIGVTYRRRAGNEGFKAGNIADFCARWGGDYEFALTLDADSVMSASAALRMVRLIASDPKIGILQGLVIGLPAASAFTRLFQFGMRLGMRSYAIGSAWWQGDCGPYWGHNAVLRLKPFIAHCELSALPDGGPLAGHVLSHDQIEAVLMRRAKYEVRVWPDETLGFEANPPTLIEFIRRDLRWCQGNMQYWRFIGLPGLHPVSRCQLALAILMFLHSPAWIAFFVVAALAAAFAPEPAEAVAAGPGFALFCVMILMWFAPPIATAVDVLAHANLRRAFGGALRFGASVLAALAFTLLLSPIMALAHSIFLAGMPFGREPRWSAQERDDHAVPFSDALRRLWPQTMLGWSAIALLAVTQPAALPYALVVAAGLALAAPFAGVSSWPAVGRMMMRTGLARLPEETAPPPILAALAQPAHAPRSAATSPQPGLPECSRASGS